MNRFEHCCLYRPYILIFTSPVLCHVYLFDDPEEDSDNDSLVQKRLLYFDCGKEKVKTCVRVIENITTQLVTFRVTTKYTLLNGYKI